MQKKHLRDIKDYFKGWVISRVTQTRMEKPIDLRVIPMLTDDPEQDEGRWSKLDWEMYAYLLNVREDAILLKDRHLVYTRDRARQQWAAERRGYFDAVLASHTGDFFLDPDTGICTPKSEEGFPIYKVGDKAKRVDQSYLYRSEIARLIDGGDRVVITFQDAHRSKDYLDDVVKGFMPEGMNELREYGEVVPAPPRLFAFAYDAVHSSAVFVCGNEGRLREVRDNIAAMVPASLAERSIIP